jgi:hypothetical protein
MNSIDIHREALKEREKLPRDAGILFAEVEEVLLLLDPYAPNLALKREKGWSRRTMLVAEARSGKTTYRMAWEVVPPRDVVIWAYGPHEGFYRRLARRARQWTRLTAAGYQST